MKEDTRTLLLAVWATAAMVLAVPGISNAAPIEVTFEYVITEKDFIPGTEPVPGYEFEVGDRGTGRYWYDTDFEDLYPHNPIRGDYRPPVPGLLELSIMPPDPDALIEFVVHDSTPPNDDPDRLEIYGTLDFEVQIYFVMLATVWDSDALPAEAPPLNLADPLHGCYGSAHVGNFDYFFEVDRAQLVSAPVPIPDPSTMLLLGSACMVGLVGTRRKRCLAL